LRLPGRTGRYVQEVQVISLGQADGLPQVDLAVVVEKLDAGSAPAPDAANSRRTWLCTVNEDGSPHVTAVGVLWLDGTFTFQTGAGTRKGATSSVIRGVRSRCRSATRTSCPARSPRGRCDPGWYEPERRPFQPVADRCAAELPGVSTGRFESRAAGRSQAQPPGQPHGRVDDEALKQLDGTVLPVRPDRHCCVRSG
jgi:pyridoxamine 5'-phosphate oxidase-like protein